MPPSDEGGGFCVAKDGGRDTEMNQKIFNQICCDLHLGIITKTVKTVSGGYMHKMYHVVTDKGEYAIKLLNPVIMQRETVFENYRVAEEIEQIMLDSQIAIVPSNVYNGKKMQCIDNQYFYVFNWLDGKSLSDKKITEYHCEIMGKTLGQIHRLPCNIVCGASEQLNIDWDFYIAECGKICPQIVKKLSSCRNLLYNRMSAGNKALYKLPQITCISNGDMDSKNVLWQDEKPYLIDLESLSYGNPYTELFQLAICWSGYERCELKFDLLSAFVKGYKSTYGQFDISWEDLYYSNFGSLQWLEYNLKRALRIECENEKERRLGIAQVKETLKHIVYYDSVKEQLLSQLNLL